MALRGITHCQKRTRRNVLAVAMGVVFNKRVVMPSGGWAKYEGGKGGGGMQAKEPGQAPAWRSSRLMGFWYCPYQSDIESGLDVMDGSREVPAYLLRARINSI